MIKNFINLSVMVCGALWFSLAFSQSSDIDSATVGTCNLKGSVSVTVLGITSSTPFTCLNETFQDSSGADNASITGDVGVSAPGVADVANLSAPNGVSSYVVEPNITSLIGLAEVENIELIQDMVSANSVQGNMGCEQGTGDGFLECQAEVSFASLNINGTPVSLPPIVPYNYTLPIGGSLDVAVLGLLPISIPVTGNLKLNEVVVSGASPQVSGETLMIPVVEGGEVQVEHNTLRLVAHGSGTLLGIGLVDIELEIIDYSKFFYQYK